MQNSVPIDPFSPVHFLEHEIQLRYEKMQLPHSFAHFRKWVGVRVDEVKQPHHLIERLNTLSPAVFSLYIEPELSRTSVLSRRTVNRLKALADILERALMYCIAAKLPQPKPLLSLLEEGTRHCYLHDGAIAEHVHADRQRVLACASGGRARHLPIRRVQSRAARLLKVEAPVGGWKSKAHAARVIAEPLVHFIRKHRFAMSSGNECVIRNIVRWINKEPRVGAAFMAKRTTLG